MDARLRLYRREGEPGMCCAVPADEPLPAFVETGHWILDATPLDPEAPPAGFDRGAARQALQSMGCYMFYGLADGEAPRSGRNDGS